MIEVEEPLMPKAISAEAQGAYVEAAFRSMDRGRTGIHRHDAYEIGIKYQVPEATRRAMLFLAPIQARDLRREVEYFPYDLPEGGIDDLE